MNSFQNKNINNKMAENLGTAHTVMVTKISSSIERTIHYLTCKKSLNKIKNIKIEGGKTK